MENKRTNHMEYMPGMEIIESDIMDRVISAMENYDYNKYTAADVERALSKENLYPEDFAALLSPAAEPFFRENGKACNRGNKEAFW